MHKLFLTLMLWLLGSSATTAANVSWNIEGTITAGSSSSMLGQIWGGGAIHSGDAFKVNISFNNASPGRPSGSGVVYESAIQSLSLSINGHTEYLTIGGSGWPGGGADEREISLVNDSTNVLEGHVQDGFYIENVDRMESIVAPGGNRHEYLSLIFTDRRLLEEGANMLSSTDLATVAPGDPMEANYSRQMYFGVSDFGGSPATLQVRGTVNSISAVPIPAAAWLFGSALAGLGWMRRKQTSLV
ncbi:MAG: VPLPA-CTERM sorting domain-containing protein [Gammaproteobacteria bacterium]